MKVHLTTLKDLTGLHCSLSVRHTAAYIGMVLPAKQSYIWPRHINMVSQETLDAGIYSFFLCIYLENFWFFSPSKFFPKSIAVIFRFADLMVFVYIHLNN